MMSQAHTNTQIIAPLPSRGWGFRFQRRLCRGRVSSFNFQKHMHMTTNILLVALLVLASIGLIKSIDIERISKFKKDNDKSSE